MLQSVQYVTLSTTNKCGSGFNHYHLYSSSTAMRPTDATPLKKMGSFYVWVRKKT